MQTRRLGRTGKEISAFTFGGGRVGGVLIHPPEDVRQAALERAVAAGCNWIDTAPSYGDGESERTLGRLLPSLSPRPMISTKFRVDPDAGENIVDQIRRSLEGSLSRLGTDRVPLVQLHNPVVAQPAGRGLTPAVILGPNGVADALDRLREEGLFEHVGISALGEAAAIVEVIDSSRFDTAQVYCNMLNPSAVRPTPPGWSGHDFHGIGEACRRNDLGVMNIRVLAAGVLATSERHGREVIVTADSDLAQEEERARRVRASLGDRYGSGAETAIRYCLGIDSLDTIVVGMASLAHLAEALSAFAAGPLPAEAYAAVDRSWANGS